MKIRDSIYLDHQATTPLDRRVLKKMEPFWRESFGNPHSAEHAVGWAAEKAIVEAKSSVGNLIGADPDEIIFTSGATEANNLALLGAGRGLDAGSGRRRILISAIEHKCVLAAAQALQKYDGIKVDIVPVDKTGNIKIDELKKMVSSDVLFFSLILVNNEIGTIQDIVEISRICRESGALFHCDGAQAPTAMGLNQIADQVDLLSLSGHKMYGPMGIGALFIRRDLHSCIEPIIYGGGQQDNLRSGTLPLPLCVGMGEAAKLCMDEEAASERGRVRKLRDRFVEILMLSGWKIQLNGPPLDERHPANANLRFEDFNAQDILGALQPNLAASSGSACTSGIPEPSHVLRAIGLTGEAADASIRFSVGRHTTEQDIDAAIELVVTTLERLSVVKTN
jgi:cysteine desulfurase